MNDTLVFILSLSIGVAAILGIVRFKKIDETYYPFIYNVWASLLVEITSRLLMLNGQYQAITIMINFYFLVDFYLFSRLFYNWKLFGHNKKYYLLIMCIAVLAWAISTFFITGILVYNFNFSVLYSFALVFFSVSAFNKFIVHDRSNIFTNARFWICLGLIIFYTFFIVINATRLTVFHINVSVGFQRSLQDINVFSNLLVNLMYAIAIIWVPRKKDFTSLF